MDTFKFMLRNAVRIASLVFFTIFVIAFGLTIFESVDGPDWKLLFISFGIITIGGIITHFLEE